MFYPVKLAVYDSVEKILSPNVISIFKKESEYTIENIGDEDLVLLTIADENRRKFNATRMQSHSLGNEGI